MSRSEYLELHEETIRKMDEIMKDEDWAVTLAKKYYPDNWMSVIDKHPEKLEHTKIRQNENARKQALRKNGVFVRPYISGKNKPMIQYDLDGNFIRKWNSSVEFSEHHEDKGYTPSNLVSCLSGETATAYGFIFKYDEQGLEDLYNKLEQEHNKKLQENE